MPQDALLADVDAAIAAASIPVAPETEKTLTAIQGKIDTWLQTRDGEKPLGRARSGNLGETDLATLKSYRTQLETIASGLPAESPVRGRAASLIARIDKATQFDQAKKQMAVLQEKPEAPRGEIWSKFVNAPIVFAAKQDLASLEREITRSDAVIAEAPKRGTVEGLRDFIAFSRTLANNVKRYGNVYSTLGGEYVARSRDALSKFDAMVAKAQPVIAVLSKTENVGKPPVSPNPA